MSYWGEPPQYGQDPQQNNPPPYGADPQQQPQQYGADPQQQPQYGQQPPPGPHQYQVGEQPQGQWQGQPDQFGYPPQGGFPPPPGPPQRNNTGVIVGVVVAVLVIIAGAVVVLVTKGGSSDDTATGTSTSASSSTTADRSTTSDYPSTTRSTTTSAPPTPQFQVNDCLFGVPDNPQRGDCTNGGSPYKVFNIPSSDQCGTDEASIRRSGVTYCITPNLTVNYCYTTPKQGEWLHVASACRAAGTMVVVDVVPGVNDKDKCHSQNFNASWYYFAPRLTVCYNQY